MEVDVLGSPSPNSPYGLCGREATFDDDTNIRDHELCESRGGRPGIPCPRYRVTVFDTVSVDVKQNLKKKKKEKKKEKEKEKKRGGEKGRERRHVYQSSGAV